MLRLLAQRSIQARSFATAIPAAAAAKTVKTAASAAKSVKPAVPPSPVVAAALPKAVEPPLQARVAGSGLTDQDRIFTNLYNDGDFRLAGAKSRGDWVILACNSLISSVQNQRDSFERKGLDH
jgi:hypothetical protein